MAPKSSKQAPIDMVLYSWGESAGWMSVALQMLYNGSNTEGLFRSGFMESGTALPSGYVDNNY